jgi:hypothetical protein
MFWGLFRKKEEEALKKAKKLEKEEFIPIKDLKKEDKKIKKEGKEMKKIFNRLQKTKRNKK